MNVYALHAVGENNDGPVPLGSLMRDGLFADICTLVDHREKKSKVLCILVDCMKYYEGINLAFDGYFTQWYLNGVLVFFLVCIDRVCCFNVLVILIWVKLFLKPSSRIKFELFQYLYIILPGALEYVH